MNHPDFEQAITYRLVQYGYVQEPLVERARTFQNTRTMTLMRALVELKLVEPDALERVVEEVTGASTVDPSLLTVYPEYIETVSKLIPKEFVTGAMVFPVQSELNTVKVCMLNPTDPLFMSALEGLSGCHIQAVTGHEQHLTAAISEHYGVAMNDLPPAAVDGEKARALADGLVRERVKTPMEAFIEPAAALANRNRDKLAVDLGAGQTGRSGQFPRDHRDWDRPQKS